MRALTDLMTGQIAENFLFFCNIIAGKDKFCSRV